MEKPQFVGGYLKKLAVDGWTATLAEIFDKEITPLQSERDDLLEELERLRSLNSELVEASRILSLS